MKHYTLKPELRQPKDEGGPHLPQFVHDYLAHGATEGSRNDTVYRVAQQYHAAGISQAVCELDVTTRALKDGLTEKETREAIASGYRSTKVTEPIRSSARPPRPPVKPSDDFAVALHAAFRQGELIAICDAKWKEEEKKWTPSKDQIKTREEWLALNAKMPIAKYCIGDGGGYMAINPLATVSGGRKNTNVAVYRHVLAEFDGGALEDQRAKLEASGFPISVILTSGKRSVHGWVRVEAKDKPEWEARRDHVFETLQCDPKNKDLARVSRCPGVFRMVDGKKVKQALLATNVGPKEWAGGDDLPPLMSWSDLEAEVAKGDGLPDLISGLLAVRSKMMVAGPSKARKSWILLHLAVAVAAGTKWLKWDTKQGKVIFLDGELHKEQLLKRLTAVCTSLAMDRDTIGPNLQIWPLRGRFCDVVALMGKLRATIVRERPSLIIADPIYKMLGDRDENAAGDINALLNELEQVCADSGASIAFSHHFAKGDAAEKSAIDRASGSGVWARDPDALVFFTKPPKPKKGDPPLKYDFMVEPVARAHPPTDAFPVFWRDSQFMVISKPLQYSLKPAPTPRGDSTASRLGLLLRAMPPLTKDAAIEWLRIQGEIDHETAVRSWNALRSPEKGWVVYDRESDMWVGVETMPF